MVDGSHGKREALGSSLGRATFFFRPCNMCVCVCVRGGGGLGRGE